MEIERKSLLSGHMKNKKEDKGDSIQDCVILGVRISVLNMKKLLQYLHNNVSSGRLEGEYICVSNVHTTVTAYESPNYLRIQNESLLNLPDGGPLSYIGRKRGFGEMERTTGPDLMEELFRCSQIYGYRHYFYGSTPETLGRMKDNMESKYPQLVIAGMYSPPFRAMTPEEDEEAVRRINESGAHFVWVGLGAPKQEIWMASHRHRIKALMIGVGAGFDYIAGNIGRAPWWMQKRSLEWLYRLWQEPGRLAWRYLSVNTKFCIAMLRENRREAAQRHDRRKREKLQDTVGS